MTEMGSANDDRDSKRALREKTEANLALHCNKYVRTLLLGALGIFRESLVVQNDLTAMGSASGDLESLERMLTSSASIDSDDTSKILDQANR